MNRTEGKDNQWLKGQATGHMCSELAEANIKMQEDYQPDIREEDTIEITLNTIEDS